MIPASLCLSVCLPVTQPRCAKTAEWIDVLVGAQVLGNAGNIVLCRWGPCPPVPRRQGSARLLPNYHLLAMVCLISSFWCYFSSRCSVWNNYFVTIPFAVVGFFSSRFANVFCRFGQERRYFQISQIQKLPIGGTTRPNSFTMSCPLMDCGRYDSFRSVCILFHSLELEGIFIELLYFLVFCSCTVFFPVYRSTRLGFGTPGPLHCA